MNDLVTSWIRTVVPVGVGFVLTWLAGALDIVIDGNTATGVTGFVVLVVTGVYYFVVRAAERQWPAVGVLLGAPRQPAYQPSAKALHRDDVGQVNLSPILTVVLIVLGVLAILWVGAELFDVDFNGENGGGNGRD